MYVGPPYCRAEMYAGRVACCPLVSHGEYADGTDRRTDGRTPDYCIMPSARHSERTVTMISCAITSTLAYLLTKNVAVYRVTTVFTDQMCWS